MANISHSVMNTYWEMPVIFLVLSETDYKAYDTERDYVLLQKAKV